MVLEQKSLVTNGILDVEEHEEPASAKEIVKAVKINPFPNTPASSEEHSANKSAFDPVDVS